MIRDLLTQVVHHAECNDPNKSHPDECIHVPSVTILYGWPKTEEEAKAATHEHKGAFQWQPIKQSINIFTLSGEEDHRVPADHYINLVAGQEIIGCHICGGSHITENTQHWDKFSQAFESMHTPEEVKAYNDK